MAAERLLVEVRPELWRRGVRRIAWPRAIIAAKKLGIEVKGRAHERNMLRRALALTDLDQGLLHGEDSARLPIRARSDENRHVHDEIDEETGHPPEPGDAHHQQIAFRPERPADNSH